MIHISINHKKEVRFSDDVIDPSPTHKCHICGHRNIRPRIKDMYICSHCSKETCESCLYVYNLCKVCAIITHEMNYPSF